MLLGDETALAAEVGGLLEPVASGDDEELLV